MSLLSTLGEVPKSSGDIDNFYIEAQAKSPVPSLQAYKEKAQKAWLAAMRSGLDKEQRKSILTTFSYQKRLTNKSGDANGSLDKHSPRRLLATGYLAQIERVDSKLPTERRAAALVDPQGSLTPMVGKYGATCGVSSVGSIASFFKRGTHDLESIAGKDFTADFRNVMIGVRARDNEFLVGSSTNAEGIVGFGVSYDMNAISQDAADMWARKISGLLEKDTGSKL